MSAEEDTCQPRIPSREGTLGGMNSSIFLTLPSGSTDKVTPLAPLLRAELASPGNILGLCTFSCGLYSTSLLTGLNPVNLKSTFWASDCTREKHSVDTQLHRLNGPEKEVFVQTTPFYTLTSSKNTRPWDCTGPGGTAGGQVRLMSKRSSP